MKPWQDAYKRAQGGFPVAYPSFRTDQDKMGELFEDRKKFANALNGDIRALKRSLRGRIISRRTLWATVTS